MKPRCFFWQGTRWKPGKFSLWMLEGKAHLKHQLANRCVPDPVTLPYRTEVLAFLEEQKLRGRQLVLATAADRAVAQSVADHLNLFSFVLASNGTDNLAGQHKLSAIQKHCGNGRFGYIGDSRADLGIWERAVDSYVVNSTPALMRAAAKVCRPEAGLQLRPRVCSRRCCEHCGRTSRSRTSYF
jgi:phosphoserine phosphatase